MSIETRRTHRVDETMRQKLRQIQQGIFSRTPYFKNLPCTVEDIDRGWVRAAFAIAPQLCNYRGIASGGILAAFCDTLMGMASRTLGYKVTTLEINMNYIRRVQEGCRLTGIGQVVHHGGKTIVVECECFDENGCVVVKGRSSFYVLGRLD